MSDAEPERIGGYRVVRRLATGGTSDVLLAKAEGPHGFERTVVLKILLSQFRRDDELARMFAREAAAYARLSHPAIVRLFDFFALPSEKPSGGPADGQLVMVLEHADGPSLSRLRSMAKAAQRDIDDNSAIFIATRIFEALAAAHGALDDRGKLSPVIHRDVNPSNVLVPWDGQVKLADFGVAKVTGLNHQSVAGMIKGTFGYMAPEQVTGEDVTPRADVYAAAIILWELLARRKAFQRGALPEVEALRAMAEPRLAPLDAIRLDIDRNVREALKRALAPRAEHRTITAEEMARVLASVVDPERGRADLINLLRIVRSDEKAAALATRPASEMPPPLMRGSARTSRSTNDDSPRTRPGGISAEAPPAPSSSRPRGMLPRKAGVPRTTADWERRPPNADERSSPAALPKYRSSSRIAAVPAIRPTPTVPSSPAVMAPLAADRSPIVSSAVSAPPLPQRGKSASERLAATITDSERARTGAHLTTASGSATPLEAMTGSHELHDAIDAIMDAPPPKSERSIPVAISSEARSLAAEMGATRLMAEARPIGPTEAVPTLVPTGSAPPDRTAKGKASVSVHDAETAKPPDVSLAPPTPRMGEAHRPPSRTLAMAAPMTGGSAPPALPTTTTVLASAPALPARASAPALPARASAPALPAQASTPALPAASALGPTAAFESSPNVPLTLAATGEGPPPSSPPPIPAASAPAGGRSMVGTAVVGVGLVVLVGVTSVLWLRHSKEQATATAPVHAKSVATAVERAPAASATVTSIQSVMASPSATVVQPTAAPSPSASPSSVAAQPSSSIAAPSTSVSPSASDIPPDSGVLKTQGAIPHRRIFVDDKTVGQTPSSVIVPCGSHTVRLGSAGKPQAIDVPCGGEVVVGDKDKER